METNYFKAPNDVFNIGLDPYQGFVYLYLMRCSNNASSAFPSYSNIAKRSGMSVRKTKDVVKELAKLGLIQWERRTGETGNQSNIYMIPQLTDSSARNTQPSAAHAQGVMHTMHEDDAHDAHYKEPSYKEPSNKDIYTFWNSLEIIQHREFTQKMKSHINARLQKYSQEEIIKAISNYSEIIKSPDYWYTHKFTLEKFMEPKNLVQFLTENNPFENYTIRKKETINFQNNGTSGKPKIPYAGQNNNKKEEPEVSDEEYEEILKLAREIEGNSKGDVKT